MRHYQAVLRLDTRNPPGNEVVVAEYVKGVLDKEGIPATIVGSDPKRPNLIARLKGNGKKRPLLIMGHSDTVTTDEKKWTHPPLSATRDGGYVYGRGTIDDKDNLTAALMTMLLLKRLNVPLDRDVIFVSEAGEEGGFSGRHRLPGEGSLPRDRSGVLPGRRRRRHAHRRPGEVRHRADAGEDSARHRARRRTASPATDRFRSSRTRSCIWPARSRRSASGGPTSASTRRPAPTSASWRRSRRPTWRRYYRDVLSTDPKVQRGGRRLAARERAAALVDAADVGVAEHLHRRLPLERDPVGSEGDARRARAAGRGSGEVPRAGEAVVERSGGRRALHRRVDPAGRPRRAGSTRRRTRRSKRRARASTTRRRCR